MTRHRSYSQLSSFRECGERFRLERLMKSALPERPAAWTALGSAFHSSYEEWEHSGRTSDLAQSFIYFYDKEIVALTELQPDLSFWQKTPNVKTVEQDIKLRKQSGIKQALSYAEHCRLSPWTLWIVDAKLALELEFVMDFGAFVVRGAVDSVLLWPDGQLTIRDLKTGNKKNVKSALQLGLYKVAMEEKYDITISTGEFWFTKIGDTGGYQDLRKYTRAFLEDQFGNLDYAINNGIIFANPGEHCGLCSVKPWCREMGNFDGEAAL